MVEWVDARYGGGCSTRVGWFDIHINWNINRREGESNYCIIVNGRRAKKTFEEVIDAQKYALMWLERMCKETLNEINKESSNGN